MTQAPPNSKRLVIDVIACRVLQYELDHYAGHSPHEVRIRYLEQGLHNEPERLREELQKSIDQTAEEQQGDAIVLGYGVCSRGAERLRAPADRPLVLTRAHDCITLLLGSKEAYSEYVSEHPGTYWYSPGWNEHHLPPGKERYEKYLAAYTEKYGEDNAAYLMEMEQGWFSSYDRATYVHLTVGVTDADKAYTQHCADWLKWKYDEVAGDPQLVTDLLSGRWDDERFLVVPPGHEIRMTADHAIVEARPVAAEESSTRP